MSKRTDHGAFIHCKERMEERYGLPLTETQWKNMGFEAKKIIENKKLKPDSNNLIVVELTVKIVPHSITVSYDCVNSRLSTIQLPRNNPMLKIKQLGDWYLSSEYQALERAKILARKDYVRQVILSPDLTFSKPIPVGCTVITMNMVRPAWIGGDIGCGISLFCLKNNDNFDVKTCWETLQAKGEWEKTSLTAVERKRLEAKYKIENHEIAELGSIGGGNHFAEIVTCTQSNNPYLEENEMYLMVHSGSRQVGEAIFQKYRCEELDCGPDIDDYLRVHDNALLWAKANRHGIAIRVCKGLSPFDLGSDSAFIDVYHNYVERCPNNVFIHHKGTLSPSHELAPIPGSRGTFSYIVNAKNSSLEALPHGAGRQWSRGEAKAQLVYESADNLLRTELGSYVVSRNASLLKTEAPVCYKDIDTIMKKLQEHGITVEAILKPVLTIKM